VSRAKRTPKRKCESGGPICSGELIHRYSVNGSERTDGLTFALCAPCAIYIRRGGSTVTLAK
jgi:hypothetical protein